MALVNPFRRRDPAGAEASKRIAAMVRDVLALGEDDAVTVSQIDCGDPACAGGAETVILLMRQGQRTRAAKISKSMALVEDDDVTVAVRMLG